MKRMILLTSVLVFQQVCVIGQTNSKKYNTDSNSINWPEEFDPEKAKFFVYNEIEINATPQIVWSILLAAEEWPTWYPGAKNVDVLDNSNQLSLNVAFNWETMGLKFQSVVKEFAPNSRLSWQSYKKSISGYHAWVIIPTSAGCKLITAESQHGWMTLMEKMFQPNKLLKYHDTWLLEIKKKAEA